MDSHSKTPTPKRQIAISTRFNGISLQEKYASGANHALIIGINEYTHHDNLKTAVNDAQELACILKEKYFFDRNHIIMLTDQQATRESIIQAFRDLAAQKVQKGDNVFIYYAGHGWYDDILNTGYWVTSEAGKNPAGFLENNTIHQFVSALDRKGVRHVLLVSDSCFSGSFAKEHRNIETATDDRYFQQKYTVPSRNLLTSGGNEPVEDGGRDGHSIFAYYFLKTLKENPWPFMSAKQLGVRVEELVTRNSLQTPVSRFIHGVGDEGGQFFFINSLSSAPAVQGDFSHVQFSPPPETRTVFDDLLAAASEKQKAAEQWAAWLKARKKEYDQVQELDSSEYLTPEQKQTAWERFLNALEPVSPFTDEDDRMREHAWERAGYWKKAGAEVNTEKKTKTEQPVSEPKETARDDNFIAYDDGKVLDTKTDLMWAAKDNGKDINWKDAKDYCDNFKGGGYTDWRMPTMDELAGLYDKNKGYPMECSKGDDVHLTELIHVSCWRVWSSETSGSSASFFHFFNGFRNSYPQSSSVHCRALPVRVGKLNT